jgi:hypothetical protein
VKLWWISVAACLAFAGLVSVMTINRPHEVVKQIDETALDEASDFRSQGVHMEKGETPAMDMSVAAGEHAYPEVTSDPDPFAATPFAPASAIELVTLPTREDVQVTIYNEEDLTLVRERRKLTLKRGWNWLQFMWANTKIDPTSLELLPTLNQDKVTVEQLVYPAGLKDIGRWLIRSEIDGQVPFELTYFTSGLSWRSTYIGTLSQDDASMELKSYVRVDNHSGEDFDKTQVRLVLGAVQVLDPVIELAERANPHGSPVPQRADLSGRVTNDFFQKPSVWAYRRDSVRSAGAEAHFAALKEVAKKSLSEYVLYTIEGTEDLTDQWGKRLLSFEANDIPVESLYKYDESRWETQTIRFVSFANDADHKLGKTPMPQGQIKLFVEANPTGLAFVGDSEFKYIPVNEEVTLNLGPARYVKVEPTLMALETMDHTFDPNGNLTGWNEARQWEMAVVNTRSIPVKVEITRTLDTDLWTMDRHSDTMTYEKYNTREARFTLALAPKEQRQETYTVTTYRGSNQPPNP